MLSYWRMGGIKNWRIDMSFGIIASVAVAGIGAYAATSAADDAADASQASTDAASRAAEKSEANVTKRLAFDERVYDEGAADREFASGAAREMAGWQRDDRTKYNALQDEQVARGRVFQGEEDKLLADAQSFDTEAKREELAGQAMADVNQGFASAHGQSVRAQQRSGVNPSSGAALALENGTRIAQATGLAQAANTARRQAETTGLARRMDAVGLGKGLVGNQSTQAGLQLAAGNNSVANAQVPLSVAGNANNAMSNGYGNAATGYAGASGAFRGVGGMQSAGFYGAQNYGAGVGSGVGNMFGSVLSKPGVTSGIGNWFGGGAAAGDPMAGYNYNNFSGSGTQRAGM